MTEQAQNKRFMKLLQQEGIKRLIGRVEADYIRDKRTGELDDDLYFSIDEKSHILAKNMNESVIDYNGEYTGF